MSTQQEHAFDSLAYTISYIVHRFDEIPYWQKQMRANHILTTEMKVNQILPRYLSLKMSVRLCQIEPKCILEYMNSFISAPTDSHFIFTRGMGKMNVKEIIHDLQKNLYSTTSAK